MEQKKNNFKLISTVLVCALFLFLPFSSWLVSLTGKSSVSLIRDILVLLIFFLAIISQKIKFNKIVILASIFIIYGLFSYFWREASAMQWLRGIRFTFVPIVMLVSLINFDFSKEQKKAIYWVILLTSIIMIIVSILELLGVKVPLKTGLSEALAMEPAQHIGKVLRLQAVLAGPNALGLYLLAICAFCLGVFKNISKWLIYLIFPIFFVMFFTFSRSALIGALVLLIISAVYYLNKKSGWKIALLSFLVIAGLLIFGTIGAAKNEKYSIYITHGTSSSLRYEQIRRLWDFRYEIGLLGRGSGTAGPSSQNRLDGGPNYWSENIYLEILEELGLIGMLLYVCLMGLLILESKKNLDSPEGKTAFLITISFAVAGLFINIYTGQVGIYLLFLANGLLSQKQQ